MAIYGVDLGTTYCAVARIDPERSPYPIPVPFDDGRAFPSLVLLAPGRRGVRAVVGTRALEEYRRLIGGRADPPPNVHLVRGAKNHIGRRPEGDDFGPPWRVNGVEFTATDVSALILRGLRRRVEMLNLPAMHGVVLTHPQKFRNLQRLATQQAALLAGLDVHGMLTEPDAAAWAYEHSNETSASRVMSSEPRRTMIFDFGGGTLDVVLMQTCRDNAGRFQTAVVASHGISCGGLEVDDLVATNLLRRYSAALGVCLEYDFLAEGDRIELLSLAEDTKRRLNDLDAIFDNNDWRENAKGATIHGLAGHRSLDLSIGLGEFSDWIDPVLTRADHTLGVALTKAGWSDQDVDVVQMTGQSSLLVAMLHRLRGRFGRQRVLLKPDPLSHLHPATIVAAGAAVFGENLAHGKPDLVLGAIPEPISFTARLSTEDRTAEFFPTFKANTRTPALYQKTFGLMLRGRRLPDEGRTLPIEVFEGASLTPIGTYHLTFDHPLRDDDDIEIQFEFARNGRFSMKARYGEEFRDVPVADIDCVLDNDAMRARRTIIEEVELEV